MENKEIYKIDLGDKKILDVVIDSSIVVKYEGGQIEFSDFHSQNCCESVYADYEQAGQLKSAKGREVGEIIIKAVPEMGFLFCLAGEKVFIPCYNSQNGYYSSSLSLEIKHEDRKTSIDISDLVEDKIG